MLKLGVSFEALFVGAAAPEVELDRRAAFDQHLVLGLVEDVELRLGEGRLP